MTVAEQTSCLANKAYTCWDRCCPIWLLKVKHNNGISNIMQQMPLMITCTVLASVCVLVEADGLFFFESCANVFTGLEDCDDSICGTYVTTPSSILEMVISTLRVLPAIYNTIITPPYNLMLWMSGWL
jgi:hypothetical protein